MPCPSLSSFRMTGPSEARPGFLDLDITSVLLQAKVRLLLSGSAVASVFSERLGKDG